ncbi:uncharacterized protein LOC129005790 [Macrosteles quadrilineatus]|uniref:uncharacterized protein LOC129005790 n=1 Tax=Macrosteles quadrilineatus TaxID=74068 RepID=UPI0023E2AB6E|nr:uncharacterized protein LOC129005790 [Macrosteles quadrilineatus]
MSIRRSERERHPPDRYTPAIGNNNDKTVNPKPSNDQPSVSAKSSTSSSRRRLMEVELKKLEEIQKLERAHEEREMERQRQVEEMERQRQRQVEEMERQRRMEARELERQKQLLTARAELESASVCGSQQSSRPSNRSETKVGLSINLDDEEEPQSKVERWLNEKEPTVLKSSSAIMTSAVQKLADTFQKAIQPVSFRQKLPSFSGKPDEWPIFFSAYEKTAYLFSEDDNLIRVRNCLEGEAFRMVKPLFVSSQNLKSIIKTLQMRFGRPELILESMLKKTRRLPSVKEDDTTSLVEFSTNILNFTATAESLHLENYVLNPYLLNECLNKLPYSLKYRWAEHVSNNALSSPDLKEFSTWLEKQCSILSIYFRPTEEKLWQKKTDIKPVYTSSTEDKQFNCMFCLDSHESERCGVFRKADVSQRWKMIVEKKLCFFCFRRHQLQKCKVKKVCGINGCRLFHHRLLHTDKIERFPKQDSEPQNKEIISSHVVNNRVLLRVCPVTLYGPSCQIDTYALLDDGSTVSLLDSATADKLGINGSIEPLTTCWSNATQHFDPTSMTVKVKIKGLYEDEVFTLNNVRTQSPLDLPKQMVDTGKLKKKWSHLRSIVQPLPSANLKPTILIGQDNCDLILARKIIEGPPNSPVLSWSRLGWTLHGKCHEHIWRVDSQFTLTSFESEKLHDIIKDSFEIKNYGVSLVEDDNVKSVEDEKALKILEDTTKKVGDRYESGLLWKSEDFKYPPSYENALKRLKGIERKMARDENFHNKYKAKITDYKEKGYIRKLRDDEANVINDRTYYLPHFGVINPNKPDKLRLVFDAAAKVNGVSFNDGLLSGPDLLNPLPAVLLKFRLRKFAIAGDIQEMFHQVRIRKEDVDSQRFLWREDPNNKPDTYIMEAMIFGSTCSPSTALYVVNSNAKRFLQIYPEASKAIFCSEYMDDLLDSTDTEEEARIRIQ